MNAVRPSVGFEARANANVKDVASLEGITAYSRADLLSTVSRLRFTTVLLSGFEQSANVDG